MTKQIASITEVLWSAKDSAEKWPLSVDMTIHEHGRFRWIIERRGCSIDVTIDNGDGDVSTHRIEMPLSFIGE